MRDHNIQMFVILLIFKFEWLILLKFNAEINYWVCFTNLYHLHLESVSNIYFPSWHMWLVSNQYNMIEMIKCYFPGYTTKVMKFHYHNYVTLLKTVLANRARCSLSKLDEFKQLFWGSLYGKELWVTFRKCGQPPRPEAHIPYDSQKALHHTGRMK